MTVTWFNSGICPVEPLPYRAIHRPMGNGVHIFCRMKVLAFLLPLMIMGGCGSVDLGTHGRGPSSGVGTSSEQSGAGNQGGTVIVQRGDSLYAISKRIGVPMRALIDANRLKPPYKLYVGRKLYIPRVHAHRVSKGETLIGIAKQYDVNVYEMARTNAIEPPYIIRIGQLINIPGVEKTVSAESVEKTEKVTRSAESPSTVKRIVEAIRRPPNSSGKGFSWPVRGKVVSSFGSKSEGLRNDGINILAPRGSPVKAADNGVVAYAGNELRGFGNLLLIKHSGGWITAYAHNETLLVKKGQKVGKGQIISRVGSSGSVSIPQLHFELRRGKKSYDPLPYLKI